MTFQITVFCISLGAEMSKRGAVYPLDFYREMYYNFIKARFYADICTNDTLYYRFLQKSIGIGKFDTDFCIFCEIITIGGRKYD